MKLKMKYMKLKNGKEKIKRFEIWNKKCTYDFQKSETIRSFGEIIYTHTGKIVENEEDQKNVLKNLVELNKSRMKTKK